MISSSNGVVVSKATVLPISASQVPSISQFSIRTALISSGVVAGVKVVLLVVVVDRKNGVVVVEVEEVIVDVVGGGQRF